MLMALLLLGWGGGGLSGGGSGAANVSGTAPIQVSGGNVSCIPASNVVGGCLTASTQSIAGYKDFVNGGQADDLWQNTGSFPRNLGPESINVSLINYQGIQVGAPVTGTLDGTSVTLQGRRSNTDVAPDVIVQSTNFRDAGGPFAVLQGLPCRTTLFAIQPTGDVVWNPAPLPNCSDASDVLTRGVLTHGNTASGSVAIQSANRLYLHARGRLAANHTAMLVDGGHPAADGGITVQTDTDGGTYFAYAGSHGNFVSSTPEPQYGSWLFELRNTNGIGTDSKFIVDSFGGFTNSHGLTLGNFPPCPGTSFQTSLGQFSYGVSPGTLLYADDQEHWYVCKSSGWKQLAETP